MVSLIILAFVFFAVVCLRFFVAPVIASRSVTTFTVLDASAYSRRFSDPTSVLIRDRIISLSTANRWYNFIVRSFVPLSCVLIVCFIFNLLYVCHVVNPLVVS